MFRGLLSLLFLAVLYQNALATPPSFDHSHALWTKLLNQYVSVSGASSDVFYRRWKKDMTELDQYLRSLSEVSKEEYSTFRPDERLAFLINAYNAFTIKLILNHYPVKSIKEIGGWFSSPWKQKFFGLLGKRTHLDSIEHDMIRQDFDEPRIHFALVCASRGCPALQSEAFVAKNLREQLEHAGKQFLRFRERNYYDPQQNRLYLSKIFRWFGDDFASQYGSYRTFVADRITDELSLQQKISNSQVRVSFLDYDWSLNDAS